MFLVECAMTKQTKVNKVCLNQLTFIKSEIKHEHNFMNIYTFNRNTELYKHYDTCIKTFTIILYGMLKILHF